MTPFARDFANAIIAQALTLGDCMRNLSRLISILIMFASVNPARAQSWVNITPGSGPTPPARSRASAVLDTLDLKMVVFAGQGAMARLNDVWEFDLASHTWTDITPASGAAPVPRITPVSVYDPVGHRMITWSGQTEGNGFLNDVWSFDLSANTWTELAPAGGPPNIRYGAAGVFDPVAGDLVTFAGFTSSGRFDDVWRLNVSIPTWTDVSPGAGPIKRCLHSASYDSQGHRMIMYGGQNNGARGDIWAFDLAVESWSELTPIYGPPGSFFTAHVYDAANNRVTVFGGDTGGSVTNEVWIFDLDTNLWHELNPAGTPPTARAGSGAVYDHANDRIVFYGGRGDSPDSEVWALEGLSGVLTSTGQSPPFSTAALRQNFPNPFNPTTTIGYDVSAPGRVSLRVYDPLGRHVKTLVNEHRTPGTYSVIWDGRNGSGALVASGVYVYRLDFSGEVLTRKLILIR
jgi:hypothetical protein